jgi:hypothetical protein
MYAFPADMIQIAPIAHQVAFTKIAATGKSAGRLRSGRGRNFNEARLGKASSAATCSNFPSINQTRLQKERR